MLQRRARRRLVGAIALVIFTVIVLPIVFDQEPRPKGQDLVVQIPSQASPPPFAHRVAVPEPLQAPVEEPGPAQPSAPEPTGELPKASGSAGSMSPASPGKSESTVSASPRDAGKPEAPAVQERKASGSGEFSVALGAYSNRDNVKQLQAKASRAGYQTFTEVLKTARGTQVRVRAGPFPTREAAEQARDRLKAQGFPVGAVVRREP